jgi:catechol 2,3-dioxygenase-like lactoylglutathione lyase family enzyme
MPVTTTTVGVRYMIDDVADAIAFYTTHLGFTLQQDATPAFAAVSRDGVRLLLSGPTSSGRRAMPDSTRPVPGGWNRLHLQVDDLAGEQPSGLQAVQRGVEGPGADLVTVAGQLGRHPGPVDGVLGGVVEHVQLHGPMQERPHGTIVSRYRVS